MSLFEERLADLPLVIDELRAGAPRARRLERLHPRVDRHPHARRRRGGHRRGRHLRRRDHDVAQAAGPALAARRARGRSASFCDHLAGARPLPRSRRSASVARSTAAGPTSRAALDLALRQAGTRCTPTLGREPRPLRFVVSLRLGEPPTLDPVRGAWSATRAALQARPDHRLDGRARRGAGGDRRRRLGRPQGPLRGHDRRPGRRPRALPARRSRRFPDAWIEDPTSTTRPTRFSSPTATVSPGTRRSTPIADIEGLPFPPRWSTSSPRASASLRELLRRLRVLRATRDRHVRRRPVRARARPRPDPAPRLALPPGRAQRRRARGLQRGRRPRRAARQPARRRPHAAASAGARSAALPTPNLSLGFAGQRVCDAACRQPGARRVENQTHHRSRIRHRGPRPPARVAAAGAGATASQARSAKAPATASTAATRHVEGRVTARSTAPHAPSRSATPSAGRSRSR